MNTNTGQIYRGEVEIKAAQERGEPIVAVSERVARAVTIGRRQLNRAERRKQAQQNRLGGAGYTSKGGHTHKYVPREEDIRRR